MTCALSTNGRSDASTWRSGSLRIGIDGRGFTSPAFGVRRYVNGLVRALLALHQPVEMVALGGDRTALPEGLAHVREPAHPPTNIGWASVGLPLAAVRAGVDLIHAPAYTAPLWSHIPVVVTIHDVSYARHPEWYPHRAGWLRQAFYRRSARMASHVITDSTFSAAEIAAAYAIPAERMTVIPLGVDAAAFVPRRDDLPCELPVGVTSPFLLHVGDLHERRNLGVVIEALADVRRHFGPSMNLSLILAGVDRGAADVLRVIASRVGVEDAVVYLGRVSEGRLRGLYGCASALVYPSLYEGFGFPLLEAMASGTPIIASDAASIPEVVGNAAMRLNPLDVRAWSAAITDLLGDDALRTRLRSAGLARSAEFTWDRTAKLTLEVYRRVA